MTSEALRSLASSMARSTAAAPSGDWAYPTTIAVAARRPLGAADAPLWFRARLGPGPEGTGVSHQPKAGSATGSPAIASLRPRQPSRSSSAACWRPDGAKPTEPRRNPQLRGPGQVAPWTGAPWTGAPRTGAPWTGVNVPSWDPRRRAQRAGSVHLITGAPPNRLEELAARQRRYLWTQAVRVVCILVAALLVHGPLAVVAVLGAVLLPWIGVTEANAVGPKRRSEKPRYFSVDAHTAIGPGKPPKTCLLYTSPS